MAESSSPKDDVTENQSALIREKKQEMILMEPYNYILQVPGKQVRTKLSRAFNCWMDIPEDNIKKISEVVQMLHNASLLIDDIEDSSKLRRGIPVAHSIYGIAQTINSANYMYFLGLKEVMQFDHPDAMKIFTEQLVLLHQGQGMDIYWRDSYTCPTEEEYKEMVIKKTGGLFGLAVRLMQLFSENKSDFKPLSDILGLYFQIRDDYANLCSKQYTENKSYCEDLTEGKFSFPLIHGIRSQPENTQVMSILRQRTEDMDVKKYCVDLLEKFGSFEYTRKVLFDLEKQAYEHISNLGGNPILESILEELGKLIRNRDQ
ncbi:geranylgeranyl pyrophosphate synthase [Strongylocentrotus purpuratus]|uniref:Geranylgeranyl pyrophosphate synthase n=1 Tax=Strongylocentrotus purpuratus TaxID=7668 RepID=A0A7M7NEW9_STRPU|nr:geranylgeranyl pyrophosphate synthase [Strongylocentrotus purpuratus]XP_011679940.2 geranylgeranyl pyrophosphate synthase [Strongylocentrotus purpuratus]XP_011679941.2 geranylgeranyl pyrophosphate synthase [Strongylocentrotus purpuratus]XP_030835645.1 geranylgeranyl pyrophosphate synthase [Strongylocentrotus purpuratus]XP_030835646.1 geranylgeranyl pyrophosphate synthase [Strongylocentrotus purpuratus]XP_030835647.1 geranylgeranyl pyrophosphate synthase [Strongylocentrotus purpuratus]